LLHNLAFLLLPDSVALPGAPADFAYVHVRISFFLMLLAIAFYFSTAPAALDRSLVIAGCSLFLLFSYLDERDLNTLESAYSKALDGLPPRARVLGSTTDMSSAISVTDHIVDRACINRCFSYANYEPVMGHFRLRATGKNPIQMSSYADAYGVQYTHYVVSQADLPLYEVRPCGAPQWRFCAVLLALGSEVRPAAISRMPVRQVLASSLSEAPRMLSR
jgi:hypothetical protein